MVTRNVLTIGFLLLFFSLIAPAAAAQSEDLRRINQEVSQIKLALEDTADAIAAAASRTNRLEQMFENGASRERILQGIQAVRDALSDVSETFDSLEEKLARLQQRVETILNDPSTSPEVRERAKQTLAAIDRLEQQIESQEKRISDIRADLNSLEAKVKA
jgi:chromosome segregation ATPase